MNYTFSLARNQIAVRALRLIRRAIRGEPPKTEDINEALETLNLILRSLQDMDIHLHLTEDREYKVGFGSYVTSANKTWRCLKKHTSNPLGSGPGVVSDIQDATYWIEDVPPESVTAPAWAGSTVYTPPGYAELEADVADIEQAQLVDSTGYISNLGLRTNYQFHEDQNFQITGVPRTAWFDRVTEPPIIRLFPYPQEEYVLRLRVMRYIFNFDGTASDTADIPKSWQDALTYMVAADLADEAGLQLNERAHLSRKAAAKFGLVKRGYSERSTYDRIVPAYPVGR